MVPNALQNSEKSSKIGKYFWENKENLAIFTVILIAAFGNKYVHSCLYIFCSFSIAFGHLALLIMEFGGIQFQKIRLVIVSGIIRFSWTLIILITGIILLVQETNKIFGDWENSYWPFGTLFVILSGYGIFR